MNFQLTNATVLMNQVAYFQGYLTPASNGLNLVIYLNKHMEIRRCAARVFGIKVAMMNSTNIHTNGQPLATVHYNAAIGSSHRLSAVSTAMLLAGKHSSNLEQRNQQNIRKSMP